MARCRSVCENRPLSIHIRATTKRWCRGFIRRGVLDILNIEAPVPYFESAPGPRATFGRPLYGGAPGIKGVREARHWEQGASTLTLLAPPRFLPLGIARGELHFPDKDLRLANAQCVSAVPGQTPRAVWPAVALVTCAAVLKAEGTRQILTLADSLRLSQFFRGPMRPGEFAKHQRDPPL